MSLVYVLGRIAYDFRSESRLNSIKQRMGRDQHPDNPKHLLTYLSRSPYDASAVEWILTMDGAPVYAVQPQGPFANETYRLLQSFLHDQLEENVERVSIPGTVAGVTTLRSGAVVPVICPEPRGMYSWTTAALVNAICEQKSQEEREGDDAEKRKAVTNFLDRVYYQFRNLGVTPAERAINFVATNAFEVGEIFEHAIREEMELDTVDVVPSPIFSPGTNCWDVSLTLFYPHREVQGVRKVYRISVDVADVVPSTVGSTRSWFVR